MAGAGLSCRQLTFRRTGGPIVLDRIEADFPAGVPILITGDTGAGKSTLLHLLGGMLPPTAGEVWADGKPVSRWTAVHRDVWRRRVGMVFQHLHLVPDLTVEENIVLPCIPREGSWKRLARRAGAWLARFDLDGAAKATPHQLSGGQRQRVAWARALIAHPDYLLLDEPTAFQDDAQVRILMQLLTEMAGQGACVIVCSHDVRLRRDEEVFRGRYHLVQGRLENRV